MAERGRPIPAAVMMRIVKLRCTMSVRRVAALTDTSTRTVMKYSRNSNTSK